MNELIALLDDYPTHMSALRLTINFDISEAPNLLGSPAIILALDVAVKEFGSLLPALL